MEVEQSTIHQGCTCWEHSTVCCHTFQWSAPTKSLYLFKCLEMACIAEQTFYYHQTLYLAPSVIHVWKRSQRALFSKCRSTVIIDGDGRAENPGHSAKYGSYGIIDMSTNKVLYIELVQVEIHFYM